MLVHTGTLWIENCLTLHSFVSNLSHFVLLILNKLLCCQVPRTNGGVLQHVFEGVVAFNRTQHSVYSLSFVCVCVHVCVWGEREGCDQHFFLKPSPFCSTQTELSIHAKNSIFPFPIYIAANTDTYTCGYTEYMEYTE